MLEPKSRSLSQALSSIATSTPHRLKDLKKVFVGSSDLRGPMASDDSTSQMTAFRITVTKKLCIDLTAQRA
jgi:hypothetical protein